MPTAVKVEALVAGRRRDGLSEHVITLDVEPGAMALQALVTAVVRSEVQSFAERAQERTFVQVLTERALASGLEAGSVRPGEAQAQPDVDPDDAAGVALLAFEDGLFQVFVDDERIDSLDDDVVVRDGAGLLFLRLVALAGG